MASKLSAAALKKKKDIFASALDSVVTKTETSLAPKMPDDGLNKAPDGEEGKVIYIDDRNLYDDPDNASYYGDPIELESMAEAMKEYGFQGVILAYPIGGGKYQIESGHRRRAAARLAGITSYAVLPTKKPETDWERKMRLFLGNLHARKESPMTVARVAQGLFEVHAEEIRYKKKNGLLKEGEDTYANSLVAKDMDMKVSSVEKYRALLRLEKGLQELADAGVCPWSELSGASTLAAAKQNDLESMIREKLEKEGEEALTRVWMQKAVRKLRLETEQVHTDNGKKERKRDDVKLFIRGSRDVRSALDYGTGFDEGNKEQVLKELKELKKSVDAKIAMLEEM